MLFVSAPVSRYFVLDLLPGRSFVGHVADAGFDVYVIDFGEPDQADRFADLDYYVNGLIAPVRAPDQHPHRHHGHLHRRVLPRRNPCPAVHRAAPGTVCRLALLTTTIDGDVKGGIPWIAHCMGLPGESFDQPRLVPTIDIKSWFEMLAPGSNSQLGRTSDLWPGWTNRWNGSGTSARWPPGSMTSCPPRGVCWPSCTGNSGPAATA